MSSRAAHSMPVHSRAGSLRISTRLPRHSGPAPSGTNTSEDIPMSASSSMMWRK